MGKISGTRFFSPFLSIPRFHGNRPVDTETGTITVSRRFSHIAIPLEPGLLQKGEAAVEKYYRGRCHAIAICRVKLWN